MLHEPAAKMGKDPAAAYKTRLGIRMFTAYALCYVGFVVINLAKPTLMEEIVLAGLNLATVYGFGLIVLALVMAVTYNGMCTAREKALAGDVKKSCGCAGGCAEGGEVND